VLGADSSSRDLHRVISRIGALIETPGLAPSFTGRRNLALLARLDRIGPEGVERALRSAGLAERGDDPVAEYSLGMRQRLGIAAALLRDPEVVVLDEPANGLDPSGIAEIRQLLISLAAEGRTVIVSSHLLDEAEKMCDRVAVMDAGRCVAVGPMHDLLTSTGAGGVLVGVADLEAAHRVLVAAGFKLTVVDGRLRVSCPATDAARITELLAAEHLFVHELRYDTPTLEAFFFGLTAPVGAGALP
jgi:ABC-2 type transport system ATP-binding protein